MVESSQERAKRNKYRRKKAMLKKVHKKAGIAFLCVMAALAVLAGRIAWINYNHGDAYSKAVLDHQTYTSTTIPYKRGQILTSNGNILAYSERVYNLILDPKLVLSDEKYKEHLKCAGTVFWVKPSGIGTDIGSEERFPVRASGDGTDFG